MRASRLLQILLLLQNRGRMTSATLARELEVTRRTILRDVDALTEAGLPMVVQQGQRGGIELGFNYRTRLTGLTADEAEAIGVLLGRPASELSVLGIAEAATRACRKLMESLPDGVRERAMEGARRFRWIEPPLVASDDARVSALAAAIRDRRVVRLHAHQPNERTIHPCALVFDGSRWAVEDALRPAEAVPLEACGDINISSRRFEPPRTGSTEARR